ncbi:MAG: MEDS domain-containing protein [Proteobacteria bacterium]|nr:MEDS domain-containing protein [Pseudomonadota bacterium]
MEIGNDVRTGVPLPGIPIGRAGKVIEVGHPFVVVEFEDRRIGYYARRQLELLPAAEAAPLESDGGVDLGFSDTRIPSGSHLCLLPKSKSRALGIGAQYLVAGLEAGDTCICAAPAEWTAGLNKAMTKIGVDWQSAVASRDLVVLEDREVYLPGTAFTADKQLARTAAALMSFAASGKRARYLAYLQTALKEIDMQQWWQYEFRATEMLNAAGTMAICSYDTRGWKTDQWKQAESVHPYVIKEGKLAMGGAPAGQ